MARRRQPVEFPRRIQSREYKMFQEVEKERAIPRTFYERSAKFAENVMKIEPDKQTKKILEENIKFSHIKITPRGVASLTMLVAFLVCFPVTISIILNSFFGLPGLSLGNGILIMVITIPFLYYLYMYPSHLRKRYEMRTSSEIVTMILYMAMHMRNMPNLEGALKFASENLTGPLGLELRKLLWDVEIGNYTNVEEALMVYSKKWEKNRAFVEAVEILITSLRQVGQRRIDMLDEAVNIVLEGDRENAKHFNQKLSMPVMVVHAMGILLPVMGLVLFPIVAVFLHVQSTILFIGYDIILPFILYFVITNILESRPPTYSTIDISEHPDMPPKGKFFLNKKKKIAMSAWPVGLMIMIIIVSLGYFLFLSEGEGGVLPALTIVGGIAFGLSAYFLLLSSQRLEARKNTRQIESEFAEALFQLGNQISTGRPIEISIEHSMKRVENLKIKELFSRALNNMKTLGFTFSQAFFDKKYGAVYYYPSKLIKTVMRTVTEASEKGVSIASVAMLSVSRYLKDLHRTQEEIKENLSETLSSLKFQALFLSPLISGIVITMAIIIIKILEQLSSKLGSISTAGSPLGGGFLEGFSSIQITPFQFVVIVGIYVIESCVILSIFINGIENGEDDVGRNDLIGSCLLIGFIIFAIVLFVSLLIFQPLVSATIGVV